MHVNNAENSDAGGSQSSSNDEYCFAMSFRCRVKSPLYFGCHLLVGDMLLTTSLLKLNIASSLLIRVDIRVQNTLSQH